MQDLLAVAALITAISGAALGGLGYRAGRRKDTTAAETAAKSVATEASEAAVRSLQASLDRANEELTELRDQQTVDRKSFRRELAAVRADADEVRAQAERCEQDKGLLEARVRELEMSR